MLPVRRRLRHVIPPLIVTAGLVAAGAVAAGARPAEPIPTLAALPACPGGMSPILARPLPSIDAPDGGAWYRLDPRLDSARAVAGHVLAVGASDRATTVALDAEAAVSGPVGDGILVASDDGAQSLLAVVDARRGCAVAVGRSDQVVRRALLEPGGEAVVEHRLERSTRESLGIWRRPLGGEAPTRIAPPIPHDERFGRTFSTELSWTDDGRLTIQSCAAVACRTRILDQRTGALAAAVDDPDQGELIGVSGDLLVTYAACRSLPCRIVATDLRAGTRRTLAEAAGLARLIADPAGTRLVHELDGPGSGRLRSVAPAGGSDRVVPLGDGLVLAPSASRSRSALALPPGWLLVSPDGRAHSLGRSWMVDPLSGVQREIGEVTQ